MTQLSLFPHDGISPLPLPRSVPAVRQRLSTASRSDQSDTQARSSRGRDQFYTRTDVAEELFQWLLEDPNVRAVLATGVARFLEPSAGTGSFLRLLPPDTLAYDIEPKAPAIVEADFLTTTLSSGAGLIVIGNPPFGKNASLAVSFFNHAAPYADVIAFIVPRTFQKLSIQNRLDSAFHLCAEREVGKDAFIHNGVPKDVPTVFQIWVRRPWLRPTITLPLAHPDFKFTTAHRADFAVQRVGVNAGIVHRNFMRSPSSNFFIKSHVDGVEATMKELDFRTVARRTVGNPSLSKAELVQLYSEALREPSSRSIRHD